MDYPLCLSYLELMGGQRDEHHTDGTEDYKGYENDAGMKRELDEQKNEKRCVDACKTQHALLKQRSARVIIAQITQGVLVIAKTPIFVDAIKQQSRQKDTEAKTQRCCHKGQNTAHTSSWRCFSLIIFLSTGAMQ